MPKRSETAVAFRYRFVRGVLTSAQTDSVFEPESLDAYPYVSYKWEDWMSAGEFGVKINRGENCSVMLNSKDCVSILKKTEHTPTHTTYSLCKINRGDWVVFSEDGRIIGPYTDEEHDRVYEIVADWR